MTTVDEALGGIYLVAIREIRSTQRWSTMVYNTFSVEDK